MAALRRLILPLVLPIALTGCGDLLDTAAALVNGRKIPEERFTRELNFLLADPRFAETLPEGAAGERQRKDLARQYLTFLIHQQLVDMYAETHGIVADEQEIDALLQQQIEQLGGEQPFAQALADANVSEDQVRDLLEKQVLRQEVAQRVVSEQVTEEQLRQIYEERLLEFSQVHTAHILVETRAEAQRIVRQATPQNFADLARRFSLDTTSAPNGGDIGPQRAVDLVRPYAEAALDIRVGEIGGPVRTEFGYHVIHVIDRQTVPFEQAREQLLGELRGQIFTDWLLGRIRGAEIEVNPRYGAFDASTGSVVERRSSSPLPAPSVQLVP